MATNSPILELVELGMPWTGLDPFIFTVHHLDRYPEGNEALGPRANLAGRQIGMDFSYLDGWSMYHGARVPGFPQHPHRGFETVTVVRRGYVDHSDSLGATARYGEGDVQWLTTGSGIQHAEMFPLIHSDRDNTLELFQIWLNLPPRSKLVPAHFRMLWGEDIPAVEVAPGVTVDVMAGRLDHHAAPAPPPDSWAATDSSFAIWLLRLDAGATWELPASEPEVNRMLHFFDGTQAEISGTVIDRGTGVRLISDVAATLGTTDDPAEFLLLQGRPIGAPVIQMGPFVMNTPEEIQQALMDYRATGFGGWPWSGPDPVHARTDRRFAIHADGHIEHRDLVPTKPGN
jgi:redox-sensitive bicupin YhaK (pirin superfamily)